MFLCFSLSLAFCFACYCKYFVKFLLLANVRRRHQLLLKSLCNREIFVRWQIPIEACLSIRLAQDNIWNLKLDLPRKCRNTYIKYELISFVLRILINDFVALKVVANTLTIYLSASPSLFLSFFSCSWAQIVQQLKRVARWRLRASWHCSALPVSGLSLLAPRCRLYALKQRV